MSDVFGDFPISPTTTFNELVSLYGIKVPASIRSKTIAEFIQDEFTDIEVGDRLSLDTIELVIRSLDDGMISGIGLDIDPTRRRTVYTRTHDIVPEKRKS